MQLKTTEELILDFTDRFDTSKLKIEIEKRPIDDSKGHILLWFIVKSNIIVDNKVLELIGESYTLHNAVSEIIRSAMRVRKPKIYPRRENILNHNYEGMDNIVIYREK